MSLTSGLGVVMTDAEDRGDIPRWHDPWAVRAAANRVRVWDEFLLWVTGGQSAEDTLHTAVRSR